MCVASSGRLANVVNGMRETYFLNRIKEFKIMKDYLIEDSMWLRELEFRNLWEISVMDTDMIEENMGIED